MQRNCPGGPRPTDVYFFATCLVDLFCPEAGMDAIQLLEREGIRVHFPENQTCCGQPAYTSGYTDEARLAALALPKDPAAAPRISTTQTLPRLGATLDAWLALWLE